MPKDHLENFTTKEGIQDFEPSVRSFYSVFYIQYSPSNITAPALFEYYFEILNAACDNGDREAANQLIEPFKPLIESLAPMDQGHLLSDYLCPQRWVLEAVEGPEDTEITSCLKGPDDIGPPGDYLHEHPELANLENCVANIHRSNQIHFPVSARDARLSGPDKVFVHDKPYFFRRWCYSGNPPEASHAELRAYKNFQEACKSGIIRADLRVCRLHGVVSGHGCALAMMWARGRSRAHGW